MVAPPAVPPRVVSGGTNDPIDARGGAPLPLAALAAAALTGFAYWPGLMSWDPVRQYGQALSGEIDDWHPPVVSWLWRHLGWLGPGPVPMLVLQLAPYWGGLALLADTVWRGGRRRTAWALLACGLWPVGLALTGMIFKDCLMAGALLVATGLLALSERRDGWWPRLAGIATLVFAACFRFNAFTAGLPLLVALLPRAWWRGWPRLLATGAVAAALLIAAVPLSGRLIGAKPSGVELSLVIFDLGGITERSGVSVFPEELEVRDPVRVNHGCYRPAKWDSYSDWVAPECPLGFTAWNDNVDPQEVRPYPFWLHAIVAHPLAYAEHRLHHFALNTRLLPLADAQERPVPAASAPNQWGFQVRPNPGMRALDALAVATAHTPLGWPIVFIALALGVAIAGWGLPSGRLSVPVALSSLCYGAGYLVFSVAAELRYHLWTALAALIATVLLARDLRGAARWRLVCAVAPAALAAAAGVALRTVAA